MYNTVSQSISKPSLIKLRFSLNCNWKSDIRRDSCWLSNFIYRSYFSSFLWRYFYSFLNNLILLSRSFVSAICYFTNSCILSNSPSSQCRWYFGKLCVICTRYLDPPFQFLWYSLIIIQSPSPPSSWTNPKQFEEVHYPIKVIYPRSLQSIFICLYSSLIAAAKISCFCLKIAIEFYFSSIF